MPDLTVIYESGVLKPTMPLSLPEGKILQIRILEVEPQPPVNQAALDLLRSWREEGDEQEQKETWEFLQTALETSATVLSPRIPGQDKDKVFIAADFNTPLPNGILNDFLNPL